VAQLVEPAVELPMELPGAQPLDQQVGQSVTPAITPSESAAQPVSAQHSIHAAQPSLWAWFKQQLLAATKK
jgi:hypothetical protein